MTVGLLLYTFITLCGASKSSGEKNDRLLESFLLEVDSIYIEDPGEVKREMTLIYIHGYGGNAVADLSLMREVGFISNEIESRFRIVAPQAKETDRNPSLAWFPFLTYPWDDNPGADMGKRSDLDGASEILMDLIRSEAALYPDGSFNRIILFGWSQGGMMATWLGMTSNSPFKGIVNYEGCFPLSSLDTNVSEAGKAVPVLTVHDPNDLVVIRAYVVAGQAAAIKFGAEGYTPIIDVNTQHHHSLEREPLDLVKGWIFGLLDNSNDGTGDWKERSASGQTAVCALSMTLYILLTIVDIF